MLKKKSYFHRRVSVAEPEFVPFSSEMRSHLDALVDATSSSLERLGYGPLPTHLYEHYARTDEQVLRDVREGNRKRAIRRKEQGEEDQEDQVDKGHGAKMVLKNYFKWLDSEDKKALQVIGSLV